MDDQKQFTKAQFQEWGAKGGKVRAKRFTKQQLSAMAKRAWRRIKARTKK